MAAFYLSKISHSIETHHETLSKEYRFIRRQIMDAYGNTRIVKRMFDVKESQGELEITFKNFDLIFHTRKKLFLFQDKVIVSMPFIYTHEGNTKILLNFFIDDTGNLFINRMNGDTLTSNNKGYEIFCLIARECYTQHLISI